MRRAWLIGSALIVFALVLACAPKAAPALTPSPQVPAEAPAPGRPAVSAPALPARPAWEVEWSRVLEAARKEGKVAAYTTVGGDTARLIVTPFKEKYGISVEWLAVVAVQAGEKLLTERRAGLYNFDLYIAGSTTTIAVLKPVGTLEPLNSALIFPDLTDPELIKKAWWKGKLSFIDKDHTVLTFQADPKNPITFNTDIVKPGEIKSYKDLLQPKFKGKIVINDPTARGSGGKWFSCAVESGTADEAYMRQLAKQEPVITRDLRLQVEWVARGKYAVVLAADPLPVAEFLRLGSPITQILPVEGTYVSASKGNVSLLNRAPHPNAAKVFTNWLLSQEGQTIWGRALMAQSRRLDVPTDHLLPSQVRQEAADYWDVENEESLKQEDKYYKIAREIFNLP